jgi:hypothetical protein
MIRAGIQRTLRLIAAAFARAATWRARVRTSSATRPPDGRAIEIHAVDPPHLAVTTPLNTADPVAVLEVEHAAVAVSPASVHAIERLTHSLATAGGRLSGAMADLQRPHSISVSETGRVTLSPHPDAGKLHAMLAFERESPALERRAP